MAILGHGSFWLPLANRITATTSSHGRLQFKTLDQVLQTMNQETGAKEAISYRCTDIDRLVPQLMGVSKVHCRTWQASAGCSHVSAQCSHLCTLSMNH